METKSSNHQIRPTYLTKWCSCESKTLPSSLSLLRLVQFGEANGLIRRLNSYPIRDVSISQSNSTSTLDFNQSNVTNCTFMDGKHLLDELGQNSLDQRMINDEFGVVGLNWLGPGRLVGQTKIDMAQSVIQPQTNLTESKQTEGDSHMNLMNNLLKDNNSNDDNNSNLDGKESLIPDLYILWR